MTHLRCGEKYDTSLVANLLLSKTVKEFLKLANISHSCEQISSGTVFLWRTPHGALYGMTVISAMYVGDTAILAQ